MRHLAPTLLCAWVLWLSFTHATGTTTARPLEAYNGKDACEVQRLVRLPDEQLKEIASRKRMIEAHTVCLPHTVDPRGPKGK
jgi:hypothetical protein